jgi:hypothetical protein
MKNLLSAPRYSFLMNCGATQMASTCTHHCSNNVQWARSGVGGLLLLLLLLLLVVVGGTGSSEQQRPPAALPPRRSRCSGTNSRSRPGTASPPHHQAARGRTRARPRCAGLQRAHDTHCQEEGSRKVLEG